MRAATFLLLAVLSTSAASAQGAAEPPVPADLTLPAAEDGHPLSLADFRGEKVILHIFASW